jgi:membrane-associated progesterone receptor component
MQAEEIILNAPLDTPYTIQQLTKYDGVNQDEPIYVAMKGIIFDVSAKREMYGPGAGYNIFAGKDASRALGKSSLKIEDAVADYSTLDASELGVLEDWVKYFTKVNSHSCFHPSSISLTQRIMRTVHRGIT